MHIEGSTGEPVSHMAGVRLSRAAIVAALVLSTVLSSLALSSHTASAAIAGSYAITDLGAVGTYGDANGINNAGQVVGSWDNGTYDEAFLWSPSSGMNLLGTMGGADSYGYALNNAASSQVATTVENGSGTTYTVNAEVWQNNAVTVLDTTNTTRTYAFGMNDNGDVVGRIYYSNNGAFCECAGLWHNGVLTNLGTLGGAQHSAAYGINNAGIAVGYTETGLGSNVFHAVEWQNGSLTDLTPSETASASANAINAAGIAVGTMNNSSVAAMWQNGTTTTLGSLGGAQSSASAINNANPVQVVGASNVSTGGQHAWIWQNGQLTDLNTLIPGSSGWVLNGASGINDAGQIVGNGTLNGVTHAFLLTPQPVAATSPTVLGFGSLNTGHTSTPLTATLANYGTAGLAVSAVTLGGSNPSDFRITNDGCSGTTVAPGASCSVSAVFAPVETGSLNAFLYFADNAQGSPQPVGLSGTGTAPAVTLSPSPVSFGSQSVNTSSTSQVSVSNSGTGPLTFGTVPFSISGLNAADFTVGSTTCGSTLAAGASCTVNVTFTPSLSGARSATLSVSDDAAGSPQADALSGTGLSADLGVGMTASAPKVKRGTTLTYTITTTNYGPGNAPGARITDTLPAGTSFSSGSSGCSASGSQVICSLGTLNSNTSATTTITALVGSTAPSSITNTVTAGATTSDPNSANNSASVTTTVSK